MTNNNQQIHPNRTTLVLLCILGILLSCAGCLVQRSIAADTQRADPPTPQPAVAAPQPGVGKQVFAYLSYRDGTIEQYGVTPSGKFVPLSPVVVDVGERAPMSRIVMDPSGRFAYSTAGYNLCQFRINEDGTLSLLKKTPVATDSIPWIGCVDKAGRSVYVLLNTGDGGKLLQYHINDDGTLSPLEPPTVAVGSDVFFAAIHPAKPLLYATSISNGTVLQYAINPNGTLKPFATPFTDVGGYPGTIAFSADGKYAFVINVKGESIDLFGVNDDGSLKWLSMASYGNEMDVGLGNVGIALGPSGAVFVSNGDGKSFYEFKVTPRQKIVMVGDYKLTRDNKLKTRDEIVDSVHRDLAKRSPKQPLDGIDALNEEARARALVTAQPYAAAFGPDGALYVANSSGIARLTIKENTTGRQKNRVSADTITSEEPAITWPDKIKEQKEKHEAGNYDPLHNPTVDGLVFLVR